MKVKTGYIYVVSVDGIPVCAFNTLKGAYGFVLRFVKHEKDMGRCLRSCRYGYDTVMQRPSTINEGDTVHSWICINKIRMMIEEGSVDKKKTTGDE